MARPRRATARRPRWRHRVAGEVRVTGADAVAGAFDALARDVGDLTETHRRAAQLLIPGAVRRSPRRSGALAASWRAEASKIAGAVVSGVEYAGPVEYGVPARGMQGARMVADTIEAEADAVLTTYRESVAERGKARGFEVDA
jgi:hypothetical protein